QYGLSQAAVDRHKAHIAETLTKAHDANEVLRADDLIGQIQSIKDRTMTILDRADDDRIKLGAIRELRECIGLLDKMLTGLRSTGEQRQEQIIRVRYFNQLGLQIDPDRFTTCPHCGQLQMKVLDISDSTATVQ